MKVFLAQPLVLAVLIGIAGCTTTTTPPEEESWDAGKRADVHAQLAASYMQRDQLEIARSELEQALQIKADHSRANYIMAVLQTRLGNNAEAETYFRRAVSADKENSQAAHDYGVYLCKQGRVDQAMAQFDEALANPLYRGDALTALRAGECLIFNGNSPDVAETYFRRALNINPKLAPALYQMSEINFARGNFLSARAYIERYFSAAQETPRTLLLAYRIENELGAADVAEDYAARLRKKFATSEEAKQLRSGR